MLMDTCLVPVIELLQEQVLRLINRVTALEACNARLTEEVFRTREILNVHNDIIKRIK